MRREKDIVGPEQGGTLRDLGVTLPPGVQAHRENEIIGRLKTRLRLWQREAAALDAGQLALTEDKRKKKEQEFLGQLTPLIEKHDLAHGEVYVMKNRLGRHIPLKELLAVLSGDNPFLDKDRTREIIQESPKEEELAKALYTVEETDSKLPPWLQEHRSSSG